jgi:hypothetical protein
MTRPLDKMSNVVNRTGNRSNPITRHLAKPLSRKAAIDAMCASCLGCSISHMEPGFRHDIRNCTATSCPLWLSRPYQQQTSDKGDFIEQDRI